MSKKEICLWMAAIQVTWHKVKRFTKADDFYNDWFMDLWDALGAKLKKEKK